MMHAGKGKDYVTVDFDACLSSNLYDSTALQLLHNFWWVLCICSLGFGVPSGVCIASATALRCVRDTLIDDLFRHPNSVQSDTNDNSTKQHPPSRHLPLSRPLFQVVAPPKLLDGPSMPPGADALRITPIFLLQLQWSMGEAVVEPRRLHGLP